MPDPTEAEVPLAAKKAEAGAKRDVNTQAVTRMKNLVADLRAELATERARNKTAAKELVDSIRNKVRKELELLGSARNEIHDRVVMMGKSVKTSIVEAEDRIMKVVEGELQAARDLLEENIMQDKTAIHRVLGSSKAIQSFKAKMDVVASRLITMERSVKTQSDEQQRMKDSLTLLEQRMGEQEHRFSVDERGHVLIKKDKRKSGR